MLLSNSQLLGRTVWGGSWEGGTQANGTNHGATSVNIPRWELEAATRPPLALGLAGCWGALPTLSRWIPAAQGSSEVFAPAVMVGKLRLKKHKEFDQDHPAG